MWNNWSFSPFLQHIEPHISSWCIDDSCWGICRQRACTDIYLMMRGNIWTLPGLCLNEASNTGRRLPVPAVDLTPGPAGRQAPVIPVPPPVSSTGTWHSCHSCAISESAGAARAWPNYLPPSSLSCRPAPLDSSRVSLSTTSVLGEHFAFSPGHYAPSSVRVPPPPPTQLSLIWKSLPLVNSCHISSLSCSVCLSFNLRSSSSPPPPVCPAGVRRATTDCAATSLSPRRTPSCQIQVRPAFCVFIQQRCRIDPRTRKWIHNKHMLNGLQLWLCCVSERNTNQARSALN